MNHARPLRIGTLGAARITPMALIRPARNLPEAEVVAVAARDEGRARSFASKHGIPRVHASYDELLADPQRMKQMAAAGRHRANRKHNTAGEMAKLAAAYDALDPTGER